MIVRNQRIADAKRSTTLYKSTLGTGLGLP